MRMAWLRGRWHHPCDQHASRASHAAPELQRRPSTWICEGKRVHNSPHDERTGTASVDGGPASDRAPLTRLRRGLGRRAGQEPAHRAARPPRSRRHRVRHHAGAHRAAPGRRADRHRLLPGGQPPREPRAREAARASSFARSRRWPRSARSTSSRSSTRTRSIPSSRTPAGYEVLTIVDHHRANVAAQGPLRRPAARRRRHRDHLRRVPAGAGRRSIPTSRKTAASPPR